MKKGVVMLYSCKFVKFTKKRDACAKLLFFLNKPIAFFTILVVVVIVVA